MKAKRNRALGAGSVVTLLGGVGIALLVGCGGGLQVAGGAGGSQGLAGAAGQLSGGSGGAGTNGFVHPGILVNQAMLDFVKAKVQAGAEPWKSALAKAQASSFGKLDYTPHARAVVECGPFSMPDVGCGDEKNDSLAAYTQALLWAYTGNEQYAKNAIAIMNAWSAVVQDHINSNAPLQSAWVTEEFPRAAEIIRYTYDGWSAAEIARFSQMLEEVYLPNVVNGSASNGNWETSMIEATINIAIFNDDRETFDKGIEMWRERTPAYIYMSSDGPTPVPPPRGSKQGAALVSFWYSPGPFTDGLAQETCRDLSHVQYGFAGIINAAETALIQGIDLYAEESERLRATLEYHAKYLNGAPVPGSLCGGSLTDNEPNPMWEIAFNHYVTRRGGSLPETLELIGAIRPTGSDHHMAWETLTHAGLGTTGF